MECGKARCKRFRLEHMVRLLALVIFCLIPVLTQVGPAMASGSEPLPVRSEGGLVSADLTAGSAERPDCDGGASCCMAVCAPCYLPLPLLQSAGLVATPGTQRVTRRHDCLRSIILGRDPPIPRTPLL